METAIGGSQRSGGCGQTKSEIKGVEGGKAHCEPQNPPADPNPNKSKKGGEGDDKKEVEKDVQGRAKNVGEEATCEGPKGKLVDVVDNEVSEEATEDLTQACFCQETRNNTFHKSPTNPLPKHKPNFTRARWSPKRAARAKAANSRYPPINEEVEGKESLGHTIPTQFVNWS